MAENQDKIKYIGMAVAGVALAGMAAYMLLKAPKEDAAPPMLKKL